jgi:hypothetical protein
MFNIKGLFTRDAIIRYLTQLPVLQTPVMDVVFTNRPQSPLPLIGADMIAGTCNAMPLAKRGGRSISVTKENGVTNFYEPFPIHPDVSITGVDLNNLKMLGNNQASLDAWAQVKTDYLRRVVRATTEAMCAVSLSGTLSYPVQLEGGGFDTYEVIYGAIQSLVPTKLWDANDITIGKIFSDLTDMQLKLQLKGYGGIIETWAGKTAYNALFAAAENSKTTAKIRIEITDQGINIGGFLIKRRAEQYRNPQTGAMAQIVGDKVIKMIAMDAGHVMPYAALDDLDSNLQPMPFFIKPIKTDNPSGYQLVAESKPLPVPNVDGICEATVTS